MRGSLWSGLGYIPGISLLQVISFIVNGEGVSHLKSLFLIVWYSHFFFLRFGISYVSADGTRCRDVVGSARCLGAVYFLLGYGQKASVSPSLHGGTWRVLIQLAFMTCSSRYLDLLSTSSEMAAEVWRVSMDLLVVPEFSSSSGEMNAGVWHVNMDLLVDLWSSRV